MRSESTKNQYRCYVDYSALSKIESIRMTYDYIRTKGRKISRYIIKSYMECGNCNGASESANIALFEITKCQYLFYKYKFANINELKEYLMDTHTINEGPNLKNSERMCISFRPENNQEKDVALHLIGLTNKQRANEIFTAVHTYVTRNKDEDYIDYACERYLDGLSQDYREGKYEYNLDNLIRIVHLPYVTKYSALYEVETGQKMENI